MILNNSKFQINILPYVIDRLKDIWNFLGLKYTFTFWAHILHYVLNELKDTYNFWGLKYIFSLWFLVD